MRIFHMHNEKQFKMLTHTLKHTHTQTCATAACLVEAKSEIKAFHALLPVLVLPLYQLLTMMVLGLYTLYEL